MQVSVPEQPPERRLLYPADLEELDEFAAVAEHDGWEIMYVRTVSGGYELALRRWPVS